jgi:hypothetical protein
MFTMDNFINGFSSFSSHCAVTNVVTYGGKDEYRWDLGVTEWDIEGRLFYRNLILDLKSTNNYVKVSEIVNDNEEIFFEAFVENRNLESFLDVIEKKLEQKYQESLNDSFQLAMN